MSTEQVIRDALTVAFLEGGDCALTAYQMNINEDGAKLSVDDANAACDDYVSRALPNVLAALRTASAQAGQESDGVKRDE